MLRDVGCSRLCNYGRNCLIFKFVFVRNEVIHVSIIIRQPLHEMIIFLSHTRSPCVRACVCVQAGARVYPRRYTLVRDPVRLSQ